MKPSQLKNLRSISVDQLCAAFARGGYTYERCELRGNVLDGERCERQGYLEARAAHLAFTFLFQDEDGRWAQGTAWITLDADGNFVASH